MLILCVFKGLFEMDSQHAKVDKDSIGSSFESSQTSTSSSSLSMKRRRDGDEEDGDHFASKKLVSSCTRSYGITELHSFN